MAKPKAVLFGPFVGELYWEAGRFAPMLPFTRKKYKKQNIKYIVLTREERFDLYGKNADILVPLRIKGDYEKLKPNCFKLNGLKTEYKKIAEKFRMKYEQKYHIIEHIYPDTSKSQFLNKNQYPRKNMIFEFKPRDENYRIVDEYLPTDKPLVVLAPRYRNGFRRNWGKWPEFYDLLYDSKLMNKFNFIICGKEGEYMPDPKHRFYDLNDMKIKDTNASLVGLLLVVLERSFFTFGSQSAIPNLSLLHEVEVLEFGCQKTYHTKIYNVKNTKITFIENPKYNLEPKVAIKKLNELLTQKLEKEKKNG
jgi:hypothetical protein